MSIGRRVADLLRSNLHALTDRASDWNGHWGELRLDELSDAQLETELRRRKAERAERETAARAAENSRNPGAGNWSGRNPKADQRGNRQSGGVAEDARLGRLYAKLECPYGADLASVRKHYRQLMRRYHPDLHADDPERQRLATELTQQLTSAYNDLRRLLSSS